MVTMIHAANFGVSFVIEDRLPGWILKARLVTLPLLLIDVAQALVCFFWKNPPVPLLLGLHFSGRMAVRVSVLLCCTGFICVQQDGEGSVMGCRPAHLPATASTR